MHKYTQYANYTEELRYFGRSFTFQVSASTNFGRGEVWQFDVNTPYSNIGPVVNLTSTNTTATKFYFSWKKPAKSVPGINLIVSTVRDGLVQVRVSWTLTWASPMHQYRRGGGAEVTIKQLEGWREAGLKLLLPILFAPVSRPFCPRVSIRFMAKWIWIVAL